MQWINNCGLNLFSEKRLEDDIFQPFVVCKYVVMFRVLNVRKRDIIGDGFDYVGDYF